MLHWQKRHSRNRLTMTAHSETGHTLTIISTGIPNPVLVYETAPGERTKTRFATLPSIELAMLTAEDRNVVNLRGTAGAPEHLPGPRGDRRERARLILEDLQSGPKDYFIIEVPKTQSLNAQRTLELAGLHLRMAPHHPDPGYRLPSIVPQTRIYQAAKAVNEDLARDGLQPLLKLPDILGTPDHPAQWLDFLHQEFEWDRDLNITARLWERRGEDWPATASRYPQTMSDPMVITLP